MSKNASSDFDGDRKPGNPQETLNKENFYYSGFFAAEMTCSVIKAQNYNPKRHYYYAVDITVTNADKFLLQNINRAVMDKRGIITPIKGGYNLSARGKNRVRKVLEFFDRYPVIVGDIAKDRLAFLREAFMYLETHRGSSFREQKTEMMNTIRNKLKKVKEKGSATRSYERENVCKDSVGYFLAGLLDGDGSFGFKKRGIYQQPYFMIAMKDRKIIDLFQEFLHYGKVRKRKDGVYHYEINHSKVLQQEVIPIFLYHYPLRHKKQRNRLKKLQRILNDYTRNSSPSMERG